MHNEFDKSDWAKNESGEITGYVLLGCRRERFFNMYGDNESNILFNGKDFTGNINALDCPFIIFKNEDDARKDAHALKAYCYDEDKSLTIYLGKCKINNGCFYKSINFIGYDAYRADNIEIIEII